MIWDVPDWPAYLRFRDSFESVMDPALYTIDWLDQMVLTNRVRVWAGENAAMITEVKEYPTGARDIAGLVAAGDLGEIATVLIPRAEAYGRIIGCVGALIESRAGWERVMKKHGYERHQVAIRKRF